MHPLPHVLLYFPSRTIEHSPADAGLAYRDLWFETDDGERLRGWWVKRRAPALGHVLLCHGNAGNVGDRVLHASVLTAVGFDVLLFDYRGYGHSSGTPGEQGTYRDAHAALAHPPAGLVLLSAFTSVREMGRVHYAMIPAALVPDAYPSLRLIGALRAPLLVLHGEDDAIVPVEHGRALFDAAPDPKRLCIVPGVGHNDIVSLAGQFLAEEIASWARQE